MGAAAGGSAGAAAGKEGIGAVVGDGIGVAAGHALQEAEQSGANVGLAQEIANKEPNCRTCAQLVICETRSAPSPAALAAACS